MRIFYLTCMMFLSVSIFAMEEDHFSIQYLTRFNLEPNEVKKVEKIGNSLCDIYFNTEAAANLFYETIKNAGYSCIYLDFLQRVTLFKKDGVLEIVKRIDNAIVNDTKVEKVFQREAAPLKRNLEHPDLTPADIKDAEKVGILKTMYKCFYEEAPSVIALTTGWIRDCSFVETENYFIFRVEFFSPISINNPLEAIHIAILSKDMKYFLMNSLTPGHYSAIGKKDEFVYRERGKFEYFGSAHQPIQGNTFMRNVEYRQLLSEIPQDALRHFNDIVNSIWSVIEK